MRVDWWVDVGVDLGGWVGGCGGGFGVGTRFCANGDPVLFQLCPGWWRRKSDLVHRLCKHLAVTLPELQLLRSVSWYRTSPTMVCRVALGVRTLWRSRDEEEHYYTVFPAVTRVVRPGWATVLESPRERFQSFAQEVPLLLISPRMLSVLQRASTEWQLPFCSIHIVWILLSIV